MQATISKVAARKAHTLNTLMNQRNSELFNKKISNVTSIFGAGKTVNEIIAKHRLIPEHKDLENKTIHSDKKTAANDLIYILNYYEFICAGINNGDFDENSMKECLSNIIPTLEIRSFHFIKLSREIAGKECFDNIVRVSNKWSKNGGSIIMKYENGEQITNLTHCFSEDECYTKLLQN
ncbi:hypothetical protein CF204P1_19260 [Citrobacter freundii]|nr:hypothetical protein CF204P1_19260 [Citrobacter freundii]